MNELIDRFLGGDRRALARAITWVENGAPEAGELIKASYDRTGRSHVIGITGPPGAGKSTLVDRLAAHLRSQGKSVGIVAVDPSSPFSGGAILGDRIRMQRTLSDPGVFMRSLASRGHLGGISVATGDVVGLMDAFGFDTVLVETVGAGQSEVEIMQLAHTTVVVLIPGMGDDIQAIKAGILEIGDVFAVNKADREGADKTVLELEMMLDLGHMGEAGINRWGGEGSGAQGTPGADRLDPTGHHGPTGAALQRLDPTGHHGGAGNPALAAKQAGTQHSAEPNLAGLHHDGPGPDGLSLSWRPPVLRTVARDDTGTDLLVARLAEHWHYLHQSGVWAQRTARDARGKLEALVSARAAEQVLSRAAAGGDFDRLAAAVAARRLDPYTATAEILKRFW